jgi:Dolichyl-phosphate-mannose-protein mannosyltransferase
MRSRAAPVLLLTLMAVLAGGAALRESFTIDEVAHIGAGVSYLQKLELRLNPEHPPLPKVLAALPLVVRGTRADYNGIAWRESREFLAAFMGEWVFGEWLLTRWNDPVSTLALARLPMLLLTLLLGWVVYACARRLGGVWGGLLCLCVYVGTPTFLAFGPLVHTDIAAALFSLLALWTFAGVYRDPTRKNVVLFGLSLAGALLSKFTGGLLFFAFLAAALSMRWWPLPGQPTAKPDARAWRKIRRRATWQGILGAALVVYAVYFVLSWNQSVDALDKLGHSPALRLLMPPWLYLRGVLMVAFMSSRPAFILGHAYPHGVWFYFPTLLVLKSPLGFLGLLVLTLVLALIWKRRARPEPAAVPKGCEIHWRVLWVSLIFLTVVCLLSRLNIGFRHFSVPLVLLILMLAPMPGLLGHLRMVRPAAALAALLAASCLYSVVRAYPYYLPYLGPLGLGRPAYTLMAECNIDWDQALPDVKRFAEQRGLRTLNLDAYALADSTVIVPQSRFWNCQTPAPEDGGQWAVVSANMFVFAHNCTWLLDYPHEPLAGGSMYAVHLPERIPAAGAPGGPPLPSAQRQFLGAPNNVDARLMYLDLVRHPETLPQIVEKMKAGFAAEAARHH